MSYQENNNNNRDSTTADMKAGLGCLFGAAVVGVFCYYFYRKQNLEPIEKFIVKTWCRIGRDDKKRTYEFNDDGSFSFSEEGKTTISGKYTLIQKENKETLLQLNYPGLTDANYQVQQKDKILILIDSNAKTELVLIPENEKKW